MLTHTRRAAIDVGTNTVRLLVVEGDTPDDVRIVREDQVITRLGHGLTSGGPLHPESARRTLAAVSRFADAALAEGAREVLVVGTSALRQARDRGGFAEALREATGLDLLVVSGEDEARLALLGTRWGAGIPPRFLLMDIGGGSTELVVADGDAVDAAVSLPLGAVHLTEAFLTRDPVDGEEYATLGGEIRRQLGPVLPGLVRGVPAPVVGTAGTVTTLAALDLALPSYDRRRVQGHQLRRSGIEALLRRLAPLPVAERAKIPCLEPGRADLIIAGIAVCLEVLTGVGADRLIVSDYGLREGILLDRLRRAP